MKTNAIIQKIELPTYVRLIKPSVLAALVLGLAVIGLASAQEPKAAEPRAGVAKTQGARTSPAPSRPKIATQKLMRDPWEKPVLKTEVQAQRSAVSNEERPYFYW